MNNEERNGKRQHVARRKTAEVRRFSDERLEQFEKEKARREGDNERHERRPFGEKRSFSRRDDERGERKSFGRDDRKPFGKRNDDERPARRGFSRNNDEERNDKKPFGRRSFNKEEREERGPRKPYGDKKPYGKRFDRDEERPRGGRRGYRREKDPEFDRPRATGEIRLNKYLADSGICSRREADDLILAGAVTVNGEVVTELGTKVKTTDKVVYGGQTLNREKLRYVLLNKPKGVITTSDDPYERHTVMDLVEGACQERIYPVGRLDRNTLGLLLLTNDGELAKTLTHPSHEVKKLYHVTLNKPLTESDFEKIQKGLMLEDGPIEVDKISYVEDDMTMREVGVEIHSGRNHIVRRIFESLGYEVVKLDRTMLAGLTKQNLPRGHWRFLTSAEISMLKRIE
ncbi:MAG: pseudouridine synthase [Bacteroidales bacterium]|jgi:23S rRNA pseudouridine2605 synthase|nr:pseudouridine synthase [Bacteroidales bacterium]MBR6092055.1 pseudouridine synthase [Bacteroidales bacterium]